MFIRLAAAIVLSVLVLPSCKTANQSTESSTYSAGSPDLPIVQGNAQNLEMDEARILKAMKWIKSTHPVSAVPDSMRDGCLQNASGNKWSDIQAHYYCLLGKEERACFTGSVQGQDPAYAQNYPASYNRCVRESGNLFGVDFDKPLAPIDGNQGDVFKHIMFTNGHTVFCYKSQRKIIESFYRDIGQAVPKRAADQAPNNNACVGSAPNQPSPNQPAPNQPAPNQPAPNQPAPNKPAPQNPPLIGGPTIAPNPQPNGPGITRVGMACPQVVGSSYYCPTLNRCVADAKACGGNGAKLCGSVHQYKDLGGSSLELYNGSSVTNLHKVSMGAGRNWGNAISSVTVEKNCTLKLYQYFDFNINSSTGQLMNGYTKALDHDGRINPTTRGRWEVDSVDSQGVPDNTVSSLVCDCF